MSDQDNQQPSWRLLNRDGTFNVWREGMKTIETGDLYHSLLRVGWFRFFLLVLVAYFGLNLVFGLAFWLCGATALEGLHQNSDYARFWDCFFFSVQTFSTIGYGKIVPQSFTANILVTLEALCGLLGFALATGLLFARFSRPTARVIYSNNAIIAPHDGQPSFLFRIANERLNQIAEAQISVSMAFNETTAEGARYRNFYTLKLERDHSPIFALSWTIVHPIDPQSPLYGVDAKKLKEIDAEFIVVLSGVDDVFSQTIHSRFSYKPNEVLWNKDFVDMLDRDERGIKVKLSHIHETRDIEQEKLKEQT